MKKLCFLPRTPTTSPPSNSIAYAIFIEALGGLRAKPPEQLYRLRDLNRSTRCLKSKTPPEQSYRPHDLNPSTRGLRIKSPRAIFFMKHSGSQVQNPHERRPSMLP